jgi:hypothetical protein
VPEEDRTQPGFEPLMIMIVRLVEGRENEEGVVCRVWTRV